VGQNTELEILSRVGRIANLSLDLEERLRQIVEITSELTQSDVCTIYLREGNSLVLKVVSDLNPSTSSGQIYEQIEKTWECLKVSDVQELSSDQMVLCECEDCVILSQQAAPYVSGEPIFKSVLSAPILDENGHCSGVIAIWNRKNRNYSGSEVKMLSTLASQIFGIIKNAQLYGQLKRKFQEQTRIYEVGKALSSMLNLDELLDLISKTSVELTNARGCVLRLLNREQTVLEIKSSYGDVVTKTTSTGRKIGEGIAGAVAERGTPICIDEVTSELLETEVITSMQYSLICVPITGKEGVIGTITLFDKNPDDSAHRFSGEDISLLTSFAGHAAIAIEHARFYERMEELALDNLLRLRELSILYHINTAMRSTVRLNKLIRIILTGVTIGGGLGFNRAILLMVNERAQTLKGLFGVGPGSGEEANQIWQDTVRQQKTLVEMIVDVPGDEEYEETAFERVAKSIWMPLDPEQGIFARTVLERKAFNVTEESEYFEESQYVVDLLETSRFATVPLIVRDKVIGVIYVDNKYNNVPINEDDMNFLQMFANQAALAIDNAMLYLNLEQRNRELREVQSQLVQTEKMTALGKMSATIAHEIRNPLICVGGFARRLLKDTSLGEKSRKYVNIISEEATRLETILQDILTFSKDSKMQFEECNVNAIIKSTLDVLTLEITDREVEVNTCFYTELDSIMADVQHLKQVFINLITNALQQVPERKGLINIMTYNTHSITGGVTIEFSDNGGGIAPEIIENIFNPFFTTKGTGTGLGLPIIRKIIDNHRGNINVRNRPGVGVTFVINLPLDPTKLQEEVLSS
jgi:two-component system sensor histidine kinase HydH